MATNFTNKYMQVFQNYNEFGEHSADYVRGEDHIAFLIEENEVIYWLYLEQVWRPLNVRTTTTGQLEDGRTKVAVRLEYVEGGQKYTSVPNIPDPERITSMAHFLEDYPDIEEVNVTGTVNLTDLSYAFAGSKIKDFSKLDTSNVTDINEFISNITTELDYNININYLTKGGSIRECNINKLDIILQKPYNDNYYTLWFYNSTIKELNTNYLNISCNNTNIDILNCDKFSNTTNNHFIVGVIGSINTINVKKEIYFKPIGFPKNNVLTVNNKDNAIITLGNDAVAKQLVDSKYYINDFDIINITCQSNHSSFKFGYGIKSNKDNFIINGDYLLDNFWLTTPIVDDAFYAKYNHQISIFQYKTTFEEVADVKITEATDSSLIYVDWNSIDFDTSDMNIEVNNKIDVNTLTKRTFNSIKIDNRNINIEEYNEYPGLGGVEYITTNDVNSYINGKYKINGSTIWDSILFKDINIYVTGVNENVDRLTIYIKDDLDFINRKINVINKNILLSLHQNTTPINNSYNINGIIKNNKVTCGITMSNYTENSNFIIAFIKDIDLNICGGILVPWYNYLLNSSIDKPIIISSNVNVGNYIYTDMIDNVYLNCEDEAFIYNIISIDAKNTEKYKPFAKNIYGIINLNLPFNNKIYNGLEEIKHIDINYVTCKGTNDYNISSLIGCDEETTINLITKLIDNTSETTATIYMYRSQANIIGDDNIAAAVAKNYEFAIIEN